MSGTQREATPPEEQDGDASPGRHSAGTARDLVVAALAVLLFAVAAVVGHHLHVTYDALHLGWPPLYAQWEPHIGPGTPAALVVAALVVLQGPALARRLAWRPLVWAAWGGSMAWCWALALVDGWDRGVARRLTTGYEYLQEVDRVDDIGHTLRVFTDHILLGAPDNWVPHVAGHPPGALLTYVLLDRIGLGGGPWASVFTVTVASSAAAAVLVAVRALCGPDTARAVAPFAVLSPAAVWFAVSADGYFAAVAAWALALLALAAARTARWPKAAAVGSGLLFGLLCHLSYGLVLVGLIALAVLLAARTWRPVPLVLLGMLPWFAAFTAAGFWWFDGYFTLVERYYQGAARIRPYGYFVWGNLAANVVTVGLAAVAGLRRAVPELPRAVRVLRRSPPTGPTALAVLVAGALAAVLAADVSGMSKAETERIWLPFTLWLTAAAALLPRPTHRWWLAAQAAVALAVNHLLFTGW
ncbi:hypothetical protein [Streptomyces sp. RKND-216]|uniref:hypothetical protein n=1 Tax=Streptomyces sp. RKND-216 TaxID=2562581 RepID=UPI001FFC150E|nr:hypothetical protein [Streptomyces sp. RKND-216]